MPKVYVTSLGCPKNLTDTEEILAVLSSYGYQVTSEEKADLALLNTCSFIQPAIEESNSEINRLLKLKKQKKIKKLVVTGCLVQRQKEQLLKDYPEIDAILGIGAIGDIIKVLEDGAKYTVPTLPRQLVLRDRLRVTLPHVAYLKIADGCDNSCAYCTIPRIRGGYRSKSINDIIIEASKLVEDGVKELVLIAQDTTAYGIDLYGEYRLPQLLRSLAKIDGLEWIRILYVYPERLTDDILETIAAEPKICKYLDMPLQHIADPVLKAMNRRTTEADLRKTIERIRSILPEVGLRTNFIVGFPGETLEDFEKLKRFVEETRFDKVGVFTYWQEKGTPAADLPGQLSAEIKEQRYQELIEIQSRVIDDMNKKVIGKIFKVILDGVNFGRTEKDAPEVDGSISIEDSRPLSPGELIHARVTSATGYTWKGILVT